MPNLALCTYTLLGGRTDRQPAIALPAATTPSLSTKYRAS
ncbi:hypothetical protein HNQ77_003355 [Silvibacterium bohemicum]|uniref:Uncharacterized protein n=1 Tax=Silvibacterium bohemicum TaxID=1577686 RepID=A0A841JYB1_9BACT|nr:hypothetical protein [Silvibacterium bohemicum]